MGNNKLVIISAPSGAGKSTIISHLLKCGLGLEFSVSATTRQPRGTEQNGVEYYFFNVEEFEHHISQNDFVEYEQVYEGRYYGTLKSEMQRIWDKQNTVLFDVDVVGGVNLKKMFGSNALSVFIKPPSIEELRRRLIGRSTDSMEEIEKRVSKAENEVAFAEQFDITIVNDSLIKAQKEAETVIREFLSN